MTWVKLDDRFHSHPKVVVLAEECPEAGLVYARALSYAAAYETDGIVPKRWLAQILPSEADKSRVLRALLTTELFERSGEDYAIHDYLDYNPSKEAVEEERGKARKRMRRVRANTGTGRDGSGPSADGMNERSEPTSPAPNRD